MALFESMSANSVMESVSARYWFSVERSMRFLAMVLSMSYWRFERRLMIMDLIISFEEEMVIFFYLYFCLDSFRYVWWLMRFLR